MVAAHGACHPRCRTCQHGFIPRPSGPRVEVTDGPCVSGSCCSLAGVFVEDLAWCAAAHEVAVVAAAGVVAVQPGVGFGLELAGAGEAATVERWPPALLQRSAVEAFAHR